jgi:hypothetical protein
MEKIYKQLTKKLLENKYYIIIYLVPNTRIGSNFIYNYSKFLYHNYNYFYSSKSDKITFVNGSEFLIKTSYSKLRGYNLDEIYENILFKSIPENERLIFALNKLKNIHRKKELTIYFKKIIH